VASRVLPAKLFHLLGEEEGRRPETPWRVFVADYLATRDQSEVEEIVAAFYRTNADA
jgi:hypothetical protein